MASKVILLDDMEDSDVEADAGTVQFAFDGESFEIDLSTKNETALRDLLAPYMARARKIGKRGIALTRTTKPASSGATSDQLEAIRSWGRANGFTVSPKGRIPKEVKLAYDQAHEPTEMPGKTTTRKTPAKKAAAAAVDPAFSHQ